MEKATNVLTHFSEWVMNLFLLHIYWIGGTLLGGILFGIIPSSIALFSIIRKLFTDSSRINLFNYFKEEYKINFKNSIFIGFIYLLIGLFIYSYITFLNATTNTLLAYTHIFIYTFLFLMILFSFYLIPVYVHYEMSNKRLIPNTLRILFTSMKWNFPMFFTVLAVILIYIRFSVSLMFFGISLPALVITYFCRKSFQDFKDKQTTIK